MVPVASIGKNCLADLPMVVLLNLHGMQADSMSSNKEMAQKYKSAADYEDDFM